MRKFLLLATAVLGACSSGEAEQKNVTAAAATGFAPGQWETVMDVTRVDEVDKTTPALKLAAGDKVTTTSCVAEGQATTPPAIILAGLDGATCEYDNSYIRNGRVNVGMTCRKPGLDGTLGVVTEGTFKADSFEGNTTVHTTLSGAGDSVVIARLTGRRTGDCAAAAPAAG